VAGEHTVAAGDERYAPVNLPPKPEVGAAHFHALDLRVGRVISVQEFPEARKPSLRLRVDFGPVIGELETSAQITRYDPEVLVGRLVVGAVNLGVRSIAGFASEFLVIGGLHPDGSVALLAPDEDLAPGSVVA
jgi:tRNA-binding protein